MTIRLNGSTSGYTEIDAPTVAGSNTLVLPTGNGTADQALVTNGSGALSFADRGRMVLETAKSATGTEVDFTGIPSWVKRVTVMFSGVSTNGNDDFLVQAGAGSVTTSGYASTATAVATGAGTTSSTAGFILWAEASSLISGHMVLTLLGSNTWIASGVCKYDTGNTTYGAGDVTLSATLDRIRITTASGTNEFDDGTINILMEG